MVFSRKYLKQKTQDLTTKKELSTSIDILTLIIYDIALFQNFNSKIKDNNLR